MFFMGSTNNNVKENIMSKAIQNKMIAYAEQHGCSLEIDDSGSTWEITLEAPEGKTFKSSGCSIDSGITGHGYINTKGNKVDWQKAYNDVVEIISYGFYDEE
jgi:hypothetical protein